MHLLWNVLVHVMAQVQCTFVVRVNCAIAQLFEVCLVLCCVVASNPYKLSCPCSSVGRALA